MERSCASMSMSSSRKRKRWCSRTSALRAATTCSWVACTLGCINSARRCGLLSPAHSACRMARPDQPITSLSTLDNLSPASSSTLWTRLTSRVRSCTRLTRRRVRSRRSCCSWLGTKLAVKSPCCNKSTIHSASCTSVFRPGTALICWALATTNSKKPILSSIHLHPIHSRALHAHVATLLLQQPGTQGQQIRCFIAERADLFASLSCLDTTQTHHQKAQMHVNACAPLIHHLYTHVYRSFLFSALLPFVRQHPRWCLSFYSVFFVLSYAALAGEATWSGSSRHQSNSFKDTLGHSTVLVVFSPGGYHP